MRKKMRALVNFKAVVGRLVQLPMRRVYFLLAVGVFSLVAPSANAIETCDPETVGDCVFVYSTFDERQFVPLFILILLIASVQLITLILTITKPFDLFGRKRRRDLI
jgi:hypothetical protein